MEETRFLSVAGKFHDRPWLIRPREVYIAGPFFNEDQVRHIEAMEKRCADLRLSAFSPRLECKYNSRTDPPEKAEEAFLLNCWHLRNSRLILADLSWPDMGTSWELGYAQASGVPRLGTCVSERTALNLMVRQTVNALIPWDSFDEVLGTLVLDVKERGTHTWLSGLRALGDYWWQGVQE